MIINCLLPGVLEMGVVLVGVVYVPTFHFKKLATMHFIISLCAMQPCRKRNGVK